MKNLYCVNDVKAQYHMPPLVFRNHDEAIRSFAQSIQKDESQLSQHPEDFILVHLGRWDEDKGILDPQEKTNLANGSDYVNNKE